MTCIPAVLAYAGFTPSLQQPREANMGPLISAEQSEWEEDPGPCLKSAVGRLNPGVGQPSPSWGLQGRGEGPQHLERPAPHLAQGGGVLNIFSFCSPPTFTLFFLSSMLS